MAGKYCYNIVVSLLFQSIFKFPELKNFNAMTKEKSLNETGSSLKNSF